MGGDQGSGKGGSAIREAGGRRVSFVVGSLRNFGLGVPEWCRGRFNGVSPLFTAAGFGLEWMWSHEQLQVEANPRAGQDLLRNAGAVRAGQIRQRGKRAACLRGAAGKVRPVLRVDGGARVSDSPRRQEPGEGGRGGAGRLQHPTRLLGSQGREGRPQGGDEQEVRRRVPADEHPFRASTAQVFC